jgi:hypothetical protein
MLLASISVPASGGGAPAVTWVAPYTAAAGGILSVRNQTELDAVTSIHPGMVAYRRDSDTYYRRTTTTWTPFALSTYTTTSSDFFTPAGGRTVLNSVASRSGNMVSIHLRIDGLNIGTPGSINQSLGTVAAGWRPDTYFAGWHGAPAAGTASGLIASADGAMSIRYSSTTVVGSWVIVNATYPSLAV